MRPIEKNVGDCLYVWANRLITNLIHPANVLIDLIVQSNRLINLISQFELARASVRKCRGYPLV